MKLEKNVQVIEVFYRFFCGAVCPVEIEEELAFELPHRVALNDARRNPFRGTSNLASFLVFLE